jgi:hypothetical protein
MSLPMGTKKETMSRVYYRRNDSVADTTVLDKVRDSRTLTQENSTGLWIEEITVKSF